MTIFLYFPYIFPIVRFTHSHDPHSCVFVEMRGMPVGWGGCSNTVKLIIVREKGEKLLRFFYNPLYNTYPAICAY